MKFTRNLISMKQVVVSGLGKYQKDFEYIFDFLHIIDRVETLDETAICSEDYIGIICKPSTSKEKEQLVANAPPGFVIVNFMK